MRQYPFGFKNTLDIQAEETFEEYAKINNLFYMRSTITRPLEEENNNLEVFDSNGANLEDEVSFHELLPCRVRIALLTDLDN